MSQLSIRANKCYKDQNVCKSDDPNSDIEMEETTIEGIKFIDYHDESQLESVMELVGRDLSEPYSIFTYRYFLHQWPQLCILAISSSTNNPVGCVVCKIDEEDEDPIAVLGTSDTNTSSNVSNQANEFSMQPSNSRIKSGYMAMLAVEKSHRRSGIGSALVQRIVKRMQLMGCTSVTLETEVSNVAAIKLYEDRLGFIREELLVRYYLNWGDAYRLRLWFDMEGKGKCKEASNEIGGSYKRGKRRKKRS